MGTEEWKRVYSESKRAAKKVVSTKKAKAMENLYNKLDSREGEKMVYRVARGRDQRTQDNIQGYYTKDTMGELLISPEANCSRWREYFCTLLNEERLHIDWAPAKPSEMDLEEIMASEVRMHLAKMANNKAVGTEDIPVEAIKAAKIPATIAKLFNSMLNSSVVPHISHQSILASVVKLKGDHWECGNYRGIKLLCHAFKLFEQILNARLRGITTITEGQFGFRPGMSTTDLAFVIRLHLVDRMREQKDFCAVFNDLEKAYDTVSRVFISQTLRRRRVPEKYVLLIENMYHDSTTAVRTKHGDTESFKVSVGLHQGLALSPYLFVIFLDEIAKSLLEQGSNFNLELLYADDLVITGNSKD